MLALIFLARRIQPLLSLVDREVEFLCTNDSIVLHLLGIIYVFITEYLFIIFPRAKIKIPVHVTAPGFELTSQRQKVSRLSTELLGGATTGYIVYVCMVITYYSNSMDQPGNKVANPACGELNRKKKTYCPGRVRA